MSRPPKNERNGSQPAGTARPGAARPVGEIHATGTPPMVAWARSSARSTTTSSSIAPGAQADAAHAALAAVGALDELGPEQLLDATRAPAQLLARERDAVERAQWNAQPPQTWIICP